MRPGCAGAAAVRLVFDAVAREVWLDEFTDEAPGSSLQAQYLCAHHAARLSVPIGWSVVDRRAPIAAGVAPPAAEPTPAPATAPESEPVTEPATDGTREPDEAAATAEQLELTGSAPGPTPDPEPGSESDPGPEHSGGSEPDPEPGSMLGRAFAWAGTQRSAITERPDGTEADHPDGPGSDT